MSNPDDPNAWVAKAAADLLCIDNNLRSREVPWELVAYHAQQAAEKMLKACLVSRGVEIPRTHDLGRLLGECLALWMPLADVAGDCDLLTPYGIAVRYPGDEPDVDAAEARRAVDAARRVVAAAHAVLTDWSQPKR